MRAAQISILTRQGDRWQGEPLATELLDVFACFCASWDLASLPLRQPSVTSTDSGQRTTVYRIAVQSKFRGAD